MPQPGAMPPAGMPYQPQPQQVWGAQPMPGYPPQQMYAPAPPAPPAPSLFNSPSVVVSKLPMLAIIGLAGSVLAGLLLLVASIIQGTAPYGQMSTSVLNGIGYFIDYAVWGVVWFALLMTLKHFADQREAKAEPTA